MSSAAGSAVTIVKNRHILFRNYERGRRDASAAKRLTHVPLTCSVRGIVQFNNASASSRRLVRTDQERRSTRYTWGPNPNVLKVSIQYRMEMTTRWETA